MNFLFSLHKCEKEKAHYPSCLSSSLLINTFVSQVWRLRLGTNSSESHRVTREGITASLCPKIPQTQHSCLVQGEADLVRGAMIGCPLQLRRRRTSLGLPEIETSALNGLFSQISIALYIRPELNMTFKLSLIHL